MKHIITKSFFKKSINLTLSLIVAAIGASSVVSCDEVKENERFIELPAVESERVILLEEFTGQLCVNCTKGHGAINSLKEQYPNNIIPVGIHAGTDVNAIDESLGGLRNPEGVEYANKNNVIGFPCGMVDRSTGLQDPELWAASVYKRMETPSFLSIKVDAKFNQAKDAIEIETVLSPTANIEGRLQLWVIENGIVALQRLPDSSFDMNYTHNHVFRGTVNGIDGEAVKLLPREDQNLKHSVKVKDNWNTDNLEVVAFVYTGSGVEQAALCEVE